jgi:N-acetylmuramic acid 6-phosphate etherase
VEKAAASALPREIADLAVLAQSPTEKRNPRSMSLDQMPLLAGIDLMLAEDATIPAAIRQERAAITRLIRQVAHAFQNGGRLFYVGAGTSGRLGVLDASEIPPTFRAPREQVQGIIAGGRQALWSAVEGAEDDVQAGAQAVAHRSISRADVVIGIAASGRTPFVWGALREARKRGAFTCLLCFNPAMKKAAARLKDKSWQPALIIAPDLGPEVLTGSTRLKAGTATKLILNMTTTLAMTRVGKVISNLMIDVNPSNVKLRDRAVRIVSELTGATRDQAREALSRSGWVVKKAYQSLAGKT